MAVDPNAVPPAGAMRELMRIIPSYLGPSYIDDQFDEHKNPEFINPMPKPHAIADAGGSSSPVMMEIAKMMAEDSIPRPQRIDLSDMRGPRSAGETTRFNLEQLRADMEPQTVNRAEKRDSLAHVDTPGMTRGIAQEAIGQAMLLGYGDDLEGWLADRHPDDIRRERNKFGDENPATSLGSYVGGLAAGGAAPKIVKWLHALGRGGADDAGGLTPRMEPDLRQAMRNVEGVETAAKGSDDTFDALQRLLSNPEARADIQGRPLELSPADIFTMTAGAAAGAGPIGTRDNPAPETAISEHDTSSLSPVDRLRMETQLSAAGRGNASDAEMAQNARTNAEAVLGVIPGPANALAARDALQGADAAGNAFGEGNMRGGLMQSALAALSGVGAVTGLPIGRLGGPAAREASRTAGVFVPVGERNVIDDVLSRRMDDQPLRDIYRDTGAFIDPGGKVLREVPDAHMTTGMGGFRPGDKGTLGEYVDHPIFETRPHYRDIETNFTEARDAPMRGLAPIMRTTPEGAFEVSLAPGDPRQGIAKLLQYRIGQDDNLPAAMRHQTPIPETMQNAVMDFSKVKPRDMKDLDALAAYVDRMTLLRDELKGNLQMADPKRIDRMIQKAYQANAGNVNARAVSGRATFEDAPKIYPYQRRVPYMNRARSLPEFQDIWTIPPEGAGADELMDFLRNWRQFGSGRPYAEPR
jgi:hypothetical protein